jgi:hypothetical protein
MSTPEPNPLELSEAEVEPVVRSRITKGPRSSDFGQLMLQLCCLGGAVALTGALVSVALWQQHKVTLVFGVGLPVFMLGILLVFTGRGLGTYKAWAWYSAVALLVPFNLALAALCLWFSIMAGVMGFATLMAPAYCGYVLWTLLSTSGRENYRRNVAAVKRAKTDPNRVVRRRYRSR